VLAGLGLAVQDTVKSLGLFTQVPLEQVWLAEQVVCNWSAKEFAQVAFAVPGLLHVYVL